MPHYFFDIDDNGDCFQDVTGEALANVAEAEERARKILMQLAGDEIPHDGPTRKMTISIREGSGAELKRVSIHFEVEQVGGEHEFGDK